MHIPTLRTERLNLLPPAEGCEALYEAFYTDAEASSAYGGPLSRDAARARLAADAQSWRSQGFGVWVIQRREQGDLAGACGFWQGKGWPRELTWWLLPRLRGSGLAQEASRAAITHAYDVFGWALVETYMNDANAPARSLARRLGGTLVRRQGFPDGWERDVFHLPGRKAAWPSEQPD